MLSGADAEWPSGPRRRSICAVMTVRDRRQMTVSCVDSVLHEGDTDGITVSVVVVDDGSSDGTAEAVTAIDMHRVQVVSGPGDLYWAAGMALGEEVALLRRTDYILWLNDDVVLDPGFLRVLLDLSDEHGGAVAVGATRDADTRTTTYSGLRRAGWHPLAFKIVEPTSIAVDVETFNGNVVLVPRLIFEAVGGIDGGFAHAYADIDYGLRLTRMGYRAVLAAGHVGTCSRSLSKGTWRDGSMSPFNRLRQLHSRKGAPPRSSARFLRRHGGAAWPVFLATPYVRIVWETLLAPIGRGQP
jgi:GT2 family glycosyltransferase